MAVALGGPRQVGHELGAQGLLDLVEDVALHRLHAQHPLNAFQSEVLGQGRQHARGVVGPDLGQDHGHRLRVFVLQIVGEDGLVHVAELVPHGPAGGAADFLHQGVDALAWHEGSQQALGLFVAAHQGAGAADAGDELDQDFLDHRRRHGSETGHGLGDLLDLLLVELLPKDSVFFAQRQQDDSRAFRPRQLADVVDRPFFAHQTGHVVSCTQERRMAVDSSGWESTKSATFLIEEAFTWPSIRAMSRR
ncbi:hypothetical protein D3C86_1103250 [compost metagenome]